ncbi:MAG: hypothetical protein QOD11_27 [Bradyrhizobium sp.]|nr:hypothetical protein [Bradyrhizobium sp.]
MARIDEVRAAADEYGLRSIENMRLSEQLGREIMAAFDKYLTPDGGIVIGVPPRGEWRHNGGDYADAAFSYYHEPFLTVRDTEFGMCVTVSDNLWVRLVVKLQKEGDRIGVFVGEGDAIWIPTAYSSNDLKRICEALFESLIGLYQGDVNVFVHGDERMLTIGFGTRQPPSGSQKSV